MTDIVDFAAHSTRQKDFGYYCQTFTLHPKQLGSLKLPVDLKWNRIRFAKENADQVLEQPGVYAFVISHDDPGLPSHGYVLYIGQTKGKKTTRSLRVRMKEYFREQERPKRPRIYEMLNKWKGFLFFYFAAVDPAVVNLLDVEAQLNDAMIPPYSQQDFSAEIRKRKHISEAT
jgi:hypothetical protein